MQPKTPKLLDDIRDAAAFIRDVAQSKTFDDYHGDRILRQAIERNFEIIGEAMKRLAQIDPETATRIESHRQMIAFRNVLIHGYDLVDHALSRRAAASRRKARSTPCLHQLNRGQTSSGTD